MHAVKSCARNDAIRSRHHWNKAAGVLSGVEEKGWLQRIAARTSSEDTLGISELSDGL
jgi:hypothetical protein